MRGNGSLRNITPPMLTAEGHVLPRRVEGVDVLIHYDRAYAVHKVATSLVDPLLIGGYTSQQLRDILVELVEEAIVSKRPTVRFHNGQSMSLEQYYGTYPGYSHYPNQVEVGQLATTSNSQMTSAVATSDEAVSAELMAIADDPRTELPEIDLSENLPADLPARSGNLGVSESPQPATELADDNAPKSAVGTKKARK